MTEAVVRKSSEEAVPKLVLVAGAERSEHELHLHETTFGRSASADVSVDDPLVSRLHCKIARSEDGWVVVDLGSSNGTLVNGVRVRKAAIHHGDQLRMGAFTFYFSQKGEIPPSFNLEIIQPALAPEPWEDPSYAVPAFPSRVDSAPVQGSRAVHRIHLLGTIRRWLPWVAAVLLLCTVVLLGWFLASSEESAEEEFQRLFQSELNTEVRKQVESLLIDAETQLKQGAFSLALEQYQKVLVLDPGNPIARSEAARLEDKIALETEERALVMEEARRTATEVAELVERADALSEKGDFGGAREIFQQALDIEPDSGVVKAKLVRTHVAEGERLERRGVTARALAQFRTALALDPGNVEAATGLRRIQALTEQAQEKKDRITALMETGSEQMASEDYIDAYATFSEVLKLDSESAEAVSLRAQSEQHLNQKVQPVYREAVRLYEEGRLTESAAKLREARSIYPDHGETHRFLIRIKDELVQKASELYKRAYIYEGLGRLDEALELYKEALAYLPDPDEEYHRKASEKIAELKRKAGGR